ncbi:MAG: hypothetical protein JSU77_01425 [Fidelibacterota bacterium]|nr:MAG: hypothetical protein JSU77_01425 [Candidatus Neomarinimicrobiota bacterium]
MNKVPVVSTMATILMITIGSAQTDHRNPRSVSQIGFGLGGVHYQARDDILAPLRWEGAGGLLNVSYRFNSRRGQQEITMRLPVAIVANRYNHKGFCDELNIRYVVLSRKAGDEATGQVHFGGMLEWSLNHQFYLSWDDSHFYWLNTYAVGPVVRWGKAFSQDRHWTVGISFPLLVLVSRPPEHRYYDQEPMNRVGYWFTKPHEDMKLTSVHEYKSVDLRCNYNWQWSRKVTLCVSFHGSYETYSKPRRISLFTNTLMLQFLFKTGSP